MRTRARSVGVVVAVAALGVLLAGGPLRAETELKPEPTTKGNPDPGSTTLTTTPTAPATTPPTVVMPTATTAPTATLDTPPTGDDPAARPTKKKKKPRNTGDPAPATSDTTTDEPEPEPSTDKPAKPTSTGPVTYERRKIELGEGDLSVSLKVPSDWEALDKASLPTVEETSDVKVLTVRGYGALSPDAKTPEVHELVIACGEGSAEYWADNIKDAAFTQMVSAVEKEAQKYTDLKSIEPDAQHDVGDRVEQPFSAEAGFTGASAKAKKGKTADTVKLQGVSFLGFAKSKAGMRVVACSVTCAQLVESGESSVCREVIGSLEVSGAFVPAPKRSWLAQIVFSLKQNPTVMWLVIVGAVIALLGLVMVPIVILRRRGRATATTTSGELEAYGDDDEDYDDGYRAGLAAAQARASASSLGPVEALFASAPPVEGYFDPVTLTRRG